MDVTYSAAYQTSAENRKIQSLLRLDACQRGDKKEEMHGREKEGSRIISPWYAVHGLDCVWDRKDRNMGSGNTGRHMAGVTA